MGVLFLKASALQLPRTRVSKCEFQEKPEEVTKCAKSLLAMQTINLFNLHSPCSEPKKKKGITPKTGSLRYRSLQNNSSGFLFDTEIGRPVWINISVYETAEQIFNGGGVNIVSPPFFLHFLFRHCPMLIGRDCLLRLGFQTFLNI